jgi:hypothetical protein
MQAAYPFCNTGNIFVASAFSIRTMPDRLALCLLHAGPKNDAAITMSKDQIWGRSVVPSKID